MASVTVMCVLIHIQNMTNLKATEKIIDTAKKKYNTGKILECNGDSKKVWQIINNVRGKQNKELKPNFVINNELIINRRIIANEFNEYFISLAPTLNEAYNSDFGISISGILDFKDYLPKSCDASIFLRDCNKVKQDLSQTRFYYFRHNQYIIYR